ncbi:TRAP transporter small permease [Chelatococcus sp. GCM10030263]|uniref:TRAP transporter small permease n=1 Tax=Chelatococcus sp. GCM10030263 TaxID=3273387 RepID=UPI00361AB6B1
MRPPAVPDGTDVAERSSSAALHRSWSVKGGAALWKWHLDLQCIAMAACMAALTVSIFIEVVTRYVFSYSIFALEDFAKFAASYMYFIGAAHGVWQKENVSSSMLEYVIRGKSALTVATHLREIITIVISFWIFIWACRYLHFVYLRNTISVELGLRLYWVFGIIPLSMGLMTLYQALHYLQWIGAKRAAAS